MGVTTSFFTATIDELKAAAPGWIEPEYGDELVDIVNPFTREVSHRMPRPLTKNPDACPPDALHSLVKKERAYKWKLVGGELKPLMKLMTTSASEAQLAEVYHQALIGPSDAENAVVVVPELLVDALVKASGIDALARAWQAELRWESSPKALLEELIDVAREARAAGHRMFAYVSL
jgi:hypothetical protein